MIETTPKRFRYSLLYKGLEYEFSDPEGWESLSTVLSRGDFHGVNSEQSQDIRFAKEHYEILRGAYRQTGIFTDAKLRVQARKDDWTYEDYALYQLDFTKYSDDFNYVKVQAVELSLRAKINANLSTQYELPLSGAGRQLMNYRSQRLKATNVLQFTYGDFIDFGSGMNLLPGTRSVRAYDPDLKFTDDEGLPLQGMQFKVINVISSVALKVSINIELWGSMANNDLHLVKVSSGGTMSIVHTYTPTYWSPFHITRYIYPEHSIELTNLVAGDKIGLVANDSADINLDRDTDFVTNIRITKFASSAQDDMLLHIFSFDWLIDSLLKKIDTNAQFVNELGVGVVQHMLTGYDCMRMIGSVATGKVIATLEDALTALDFLECIAVDVSGNVLTIMHRDQAYNPVSGVSVECSNLQMEHDIDHVYNTVKVSSGVSSSNEGSDSLFSDLQFGVKNVISYGSEQGRELDLTCPYILDPLVIDEKIKNYVGDEPDDKNRNEIAVFAVEPFTPSANSNASGSAEKIYASNSGLQYVVLDSISAIGDSATYTTGGISIFSIQFRKAGNTAVHVELSGTITGAIPQTPERSSDGSLVVLSEDPIYNGQTGEYSFVGDYTVNAEVDSVFTFRLAIQTGTNPSVNLVAEAFTSVDAPPPNLYRNQTITGYTGDAASAYNIAYTPRRILDKHTRYLATSVQGSPSRLFAYLSSVSRLNVISKLGVESTEVIENSDLDLTNVVPLFLPLIATFDTEADYEAIKFLRDTKYGYVSTVYRGKRLNGFIKTCSAAVGKEKTQEWEIILQSYDL